MDKSLSNHLISPSLSSSNYYFVLFLVWPFLAFLTAIMNYSQKEARKTVYMFLVYFGLTYIISVEGYVDAAGYAMDLKANAQLPFSDFFNIVGGLYNSGTSVDIIEPFISFIVSRFTDNHRILFAVYAAVFGFFYLKSISLIYNRYRENPGWNVLIFQIFFILILPITSINGFRMWTAAWIFFYGAYHVVLYRDPRYILIALSASLVHFSFLSANIILLIFYLAGNRNFIYLPVALASFVLPQLLSPVFESISLALGGGLQGRFESYSSGEYIIGNRESFEQASWFLKIEKDMVFYYLLLVIIIIQLRFRNLMKNKAGKNLFSFLLLFLAFVNFGKSIPAFGTRFQIIFFLFATLYVIMCLVKLPGEKVSFLTLVGMFPMVLYVVVSFRQYSDSINAWIIAPGMGLPFLVPDLSFADFLFH
jgi:hypothetical protein